MCGIWFSIGFEYTDKCIDLVAHRGPDGTHTRTVNLSNHEYTIAHRRLSIIDLHQRSDQPFFSQDEQYCITYNGQIYNYLELKNELISMGYTFKTTSDTEVLLTSYMEWGEACLDRLQGMFAFVIIDKQSNKFFAARDRYGIKPLYIYRDGAKIAIASEIKQFTGLQQFKANANEEHIALYLSSGAQDFNQATMFSSVHQLKPGHKLSHNLRENLQTLDQVKWFASKKEDISHFTSDELIERFIELFAQSMRLHLRSDVPIGGCLSGGLDSSFLAHEMLNRLEKDGIDIAPNFITAGFKGQSFDESNIAAGFAKNRNINHSLVYPEKGYAKDNLDKIIWAQDEPFASTSIIAQHSVFSNAQRNGLKVMLDGQGADEAMAGYTYLLKYFTANLLAGGRLFQAHKFMSDQKNLRGLSIARQLISSLSLFAPSALTHTLSANKKPNWLRRSRKLQAPFNFRKHKNWMIEKGSLPALLHWEDRNAMAFGIETRLPYLHPPLMEFLTNLPNSKAYNSGKTKPLLRGAAQNALPVQITENHKKIGFSSPEDAWTQALLSKTDQTDIDRLVQTFPKLVNPDSFSLKSLKEASSDYSGICFRAICLSRWAKLYGVS